MRSVLFCLLLGLGGAAVWFQSGAASPILSGWLTAGVAKEFPGTQVQALGLRLVGPLRLGAHSVRWLNPRGDLILELQDPLLGAGLHSRGKLSWELTARVSRLDLALTDQTLAQGRWKATGTLRGQLRLSAASGRVEAVGVKLEALEPGGDLNNDLLINLLSLLPAGGGSQGQILQALQGRPTFRYKIGRFELATEEDVYRLGLLLDGDHLLDLTVRVPKDSVELLKEIFLTEGSTRE